MATGLTEAAATAPPAIPRFLKNSRREVMFLSFDSVVSPTASGNAGAGGGIQGGLADQRHLQIPLGNPEIGQGFDIAVHATNLRPRIGQEIEDTDQHAVVAQHALVGNALVERNDLIAVMRCDVVIGTIGVIGLTYLRADVGGDLGSALDSLHVYGFGLGHLGATPIEDRQLEADLVAFLIATVPF